MFFRTNHKYLDGKQSLHQVSQEHCERILRNLKKNFRANASAPLAFCQIELRVTRENNLVNRKKIFFFLTKFNISLRFCKNAMHPHIFL